MNKIYLPPGTTISFGGNMHVGEDGTINSLSFENPRFATPTIEYEASVVFGELTYDVKTEPETGKLYIDFDGGR